MVKKQELVTRARRAVKLKARIDVWLYIHVPLTIALLATLERPYRQRVLLLVSAMRLLIITVTRNRKGQAVRAERTIEGESFAVGRGTKCAIHLPDPRVALEHATIYRSGRRDSSFRVGCATLLVDGGPEREAVLAPRVRDRNRPLRDDRRDAAPGLRPGPSDRARAAAARRPRGDQGQVAPSLDGDRCSRSARRHGSSRSIVLLLFLAIPIINASMPQRCAMPPRSSRSRPTSRGSRARSPPGTRDSATIAASATRCRSCGCATTSASVAIRDPRTRADGRAAVEALRRNALRRLPRRPQGRRGPRAHRRRLVRRLPPRPQAAHAGHEAADASDFAMRIPTSS